MFLTSTTDVINTPIATLIADAAKTGLGVLLLGMAIVFAVLAVIFAALVIMRKSLTKKPAPAEKAPVQEKTEDVPAAEPAEQPAAEQDDGAIVAAIVAAISAYTGKPATAFRVVSFKRRH